MRKIVRAPFRKGYTYYPEERTLLGRRSGIDEWEHHADRLLVLCSNYLWRVL